LNLFELFVKIGVDDQASGKLSDLSSKLGNGLKTAAKIGTAAVGAAAAGITALTKSAVDNYAEYEQLVGGVETLFKDSANSLMSYAGEAYKAQGISANEYMSLATSFSASLLQSLEGDTDRAVEATNLAITDMSDNANKMGTSMEMIQNAYNGFAKANYTMLDNLKLGYGGTKEEMERLIADAAELSDTVDAQSMSFANIVEAIHVVQTEMGITGTTALEASTTISGSVNTMKAAWADFLTSLADENADYQWQLDNLFESVKTVAGNVFPVVEQVFWSITDLMDDILPEIIDKIPQIIDDGLPRVVEMAVKLVQSFIGGISKNQDQLLSSAFKVINTLIDGITEMLPDIIVTGALLLGKLAVGIIQAIPTLVSKIPEIITAIVNGFKAKTSDFKNIGYNIISGIRNGISNAWSNLKTWFKNLFGDLIGIAKKILGIASPSKVFKKIGGFTAEGFGAGFEDEFAHVKDDMEDALNFDDASVGINASIRKMGAGAAGGAFGGTSIGNININIDGAKYSDEQSLASAIALEIQNMTDRRAAVYA
jgi:phage-related protein